MYALHLCTRIYINNQNSNAIVEEFYIGTKSMTSQVFSPFHQIFLVFFQWCTHVHVHFVMYCALFTTKLKH